MAFLKNRRRPFVAPAGVNTAPQQLLYSAPFKYDEEGQPAVSLQKLETGGHVSLVKGFTAAKKALDNVQLAGIRFQVIVLVDGSGSMGADYRPQPDGRPSNVEQMLLRVLGFTLNVDKDGSIPVIVYGGSVNPPVDVDLSNYRDIGRIITPDFWSTSMTEALDAALKIAAQRNKQGDYELTLIVNITDGNPNNRATMSNVVIRSSGAPVMLKNLAIRPVPYLEEIDDLPSQYEIRKEDDGNGNDVPVKDADGRLVIDRNPTGLRLIDNVDSKALNPHTASDEEFAKAIADEISDCIEVMARVGLLTNVPGVDRLF
jgi:hypothetical protein